MTRCDRFQLHYELSDWIEKMNERGEEDGDSIDAQPRTHRRTGH